MSNNITFICGNARKDFTFDGKRTIFDLLSEAGFKVDFPCGGNKTCGKCKIKLLEGHEFASEPDETEKRYLSEEEIRENIRYACMCAVFGNVTAELSPKSNMEIQTDGLKSKDTAPDKFRKITVTLSESTLKNPISDEKNLISAINNALKDEAEEFDEVKRLPFGIIKNLTEIKNRDKNTKEIDVVLSVVKNSESLAAKLIGIRKAGECGDIYGAAIDIGTTTAAVYLYSLTGGNCIGVASGENPQRAYGADVITRINYTIENENRGGLDNLKRLILALIFKLIKNLCEENNISPNDIYSLVLTGNTVMQHIAAGLPPRNIAFTPFTAVTLFGFEITANELLSSLDMPEETVCVNSDAVIYFPPAVASYVGGDITAGIIASDTDLCGKLRLFLDIGTNGEIGLGDSNSLIFCATAAGPAFEGAHIKLGMAGVKGAVNKIYLDGENKIICETVGNAEPKGICGSGIIDAVALMLDAGVLDETGRIAPGGSDGNFAGNLCETDGENAFILNREHNIYITQKDIREIQLAKAAVSAGIMTLLDRAGKSVSDVGEIVLAGGFGARINKKNACKIGLIPQELEDRIITAGNTAGTGAAAVLLNCSAAERITRVCEISKYIELSGDAFFMDEYVDRMTF